MSEPIVPEIVNVVPGERFSSRMSTVTILSLAFMVGLLFYLLHETNKYASERIVHLQKELSDASYERDIYQSRAEEKYKEARVNASEGTGNDDGGESISNEAL